MCIGKMTKFAQLIEKCNILKYERRIRAYSQNLPRS